MPRHYDLAVAGAGVGGLAAAALSARNRKRVVIVTPSETVGGALESVHRDGFIFSTGPALSFGFERGGALQELCSELGISQSSAVLSPCYQVALPDRRISVFLENGETIEELRREFPHEIDAVARFYRKVRDTAERNARSRFFSAYSHHRKAGTFLERFRFSRELRAFFDSASLGFFRRRAADMPLRDFITLVDTPPIVVQGGFKQFCDQVLSNFLKNGGEIRYQESQIDIARDGNRARGLVSADGSALDAETILINTPPAPASSTVFMGVRRDGIPLGMSHEVLCLPDYGSPGSFFTLSVSPPDGNDAPRGMSVMTATFPFIAPGAKRLQELTDSVASLVPFLDQFLVTADEHSPGTAAYELPVLKTPRSALAGPSYLRSSLKQLYLIPDDSGNPLGAVAAARDLVKKIF